MIAPETLRGSAQASALPALLRQLVRHRQTGLLRFARGSLTKTAYLSEGRLIFASSADPDDRLGEMLLRKGLISYAGLEESVRALQAGKRQGTILVESGAIRSRDLIEGVTEQVREIILSLFLAEEGDFEFTAGDLPSREVIVLRMSTADLIMEGIRRLNRWSRIRAGVGSLGQRYLLAADPAAILSSMSLDKDELALLAVLDGVMSLEAVCAAVRQSDFFACRTVYGLWAVGALDRVPQDAAEETPLRDKTEPHAERLTGASVGREIERFNELHQLLFELVNYQLREQAPLFFERVFQQASAEHGDLFAGVAVDGRGELDSIALRSNIVSHEIARYLKGLDRLLEIEVALARDLLGERKAAIIDDGLMAIKERQLKEGGGDR
ncbi:MAG TPA: DUF4388 domain-containing protein [Vicinamibacteria bacterium]|nr:DUF4388 domain-containing protein [Vicinamibacteria bacterium]